ncbi:hypothetical protein O3Q51_10095 [Cryomorphaceae bacterium 1068]|nr:hypothetical protein [Cryomorphaceae bacterium 1068]
MKDQTSRFLSIIILPMLLVSCMSSKYFQVFETAAITENAAVEEKIKFETEELAFIYDFWSNKGDFGFQVWNQSDSMIVIDLENTFYVRNGRANPYYADGEITYSTSRATTASAQNNYLNPYHNPYYLTSSSLSASAGSSSGLSRTYENPRKIKVPANTFIEVMGFSMVSGFKNVCGMEVYPTAKETATQDYTVDNSPIIFTNRISYTSEGELKSVEHSFYVSNITNMPQSQALTTLATDDCGNKLYIPKTVFAVGNPKSFYFEYVRK